MKLRYESRFSAEQLGLKIRWALIAAATVLLSERISNPYVLGTIGLIALVNLIGHRLCANRNTYDRIGKSFLQKARFADGIIVASAGLLFQIVAGHNLWLLGIPVLLSEALVSRDRKSIAILAIAMVVARAVAWKISHEGLTLLIVPAVVYLVGALVGSVLSSYKARDEMLTSHDKRLATVLDCGSALAASRDLRATIMHTLKSAVLETGATCGYVMLVDEDEPTTLRTEVAYGAEGEFTFPERLEIGDGMSGYVAKMGQPVSISSAPGETQEYDGMTADVRSAMAVPLIARTYNSTGQSSSETVLGVLTLLSLLHSDAFDAEELEMVRTIASLIAVAVANARMEERQRSTFVRTLESLATALEARDEYTRGHSQRVSEVSLMIGDQMGLSLDALEELRVGTILHDIGKIGVPDAILNKRDRLTDDEFTVMKTHPVIGYEICKPLRLSEGILLIIRNHHEKLDGSGYPDGLKGGELPLSLRIVCVADAFDAMSSRRPYRAVMESHTVMAEMSRCAGTQFDPVIVESLKELIRSPRMQALYKIYWEPVGAEAA